MLRAACLLRLRLRHPREDLRRHPQDVAPDDARAPGAIAALRRPLPTDATARGTTTDTRRRCPAARGAVCPVDGPTARRITAAASSRVETRGGEHGEQEHGRPDDGLLHFRLLVAVVGTRLPNRFRAEHGRVRYARSCSQDPWVADYDTISPLALVMPMRTTSPRCGRHGQAHLVPVTGACVSKKRKICVRIRFQASPRADPRLRRAASRATPRITAPSAGRPRLRARSLRAG